MLEYDSIDRLVREAESRGVRISELVLADQAKAMEQTELEVHLEVHHQKNWTIPLLLFFYSSV